MAMARTKRREQRDAMRVTTNPAERKMTSLVAAAVSVRVTAGIQNIRWGGSDWAQEGWLHYDTCPEFHAGIEINSANMSRARLFGTEVDPITGQPGETATTDPDVADIMSQLFGGASGQGQALAAISQHLDVAGDCWAFATPDPDIDMGIWEVLSTTEVTSGGGNRIMIEQLNGIPRPVDTENELLLRIWKKHPKHRWDADAPTRSLLPVLRELSALTAMVSATVKSRLASAGILWIPEELTLPRTMGQTQGPSEVRSESAGPAQAWLDLITEGMVAPIRDPDSAAAVVPIITTVAGDQIKNIVHMEFGKDLDAQIQPLREACTKRLAVGMNLPPTVLLGMEAANHWTAWTITEDYAKAYIAPKLELIADALTQFYLQPALKMRGKDWRRFAVYFDLSSLYPKQITTENALSAYNLGLLKELVLLRELGFGPNDLADPDERARRLVTEAIARGNPVTLVELAETIARIWPGIVIQPASPEGQVGKSITGNVPAASVPTPPVVGGAAPTATGAPPKAGTPPTAGVPAP